MTLYQWMNEIQQHFPNLKKWQAVGLALFSYGVVIARRCQTSVVAEELPRQGKADTIQRRLQRWLSNPRIQVKVCCQWWVRWVWSRYDAARPNLLVDETKLGARIGVMMISLAFEQRAIPLIWCCYIANSAKDYPVEGQVKLIERLLGTILPCFPVGCRPLLQADRGIGNSSNRIRAMQQLGVTFLFRVKKNSRFTIASGKSHGLADLVKPGEQGSGRGVLFTDEHRVRVIAHVIWEIGQKEPWCLVTNDPTIRGAFYATRMWQEESFRDLKSGGWQWQCTQIDDSRRAERLILVLAVAYAWMLTLGTFVLHADKATQLEVTKGNDGKYSVFRLGLRYMKRMLAVNPARIYVGLFFIPH